MKTICHVAASGAVFLYFDQLHPELKPCGKDLFEIIGNLIDYHECSKLTIEDQCIQHIVEISEATLLRVLVASCYRTDFIL